MAENIADKNNALSWLVPEYEKHERTRNWYIAAAAAGLLILLFSFYTNNFLFAVIIAIASLIIAINGKGEPDKVRVELGSEGITIGKKFYDYDEFKNFAVVYKPRQNVKSIYFDFKSHVRPTLPLPLGDEDPLTARKFLLKYLAENLERTDQPLSEALGKFFKL